MVVFRLYLNSYEYFLSREEFQVDPVHIILFSFGFKYGPPEADTVFDVRFLPNPYWVPELKPFTGLHQPVAQYVLHNATGQEFLILVEAFLEFFLAVHKEAGREEIRLAVGCTGGRHRSVAVTESLRRFLDGQPFTVDVFHRDIGKE